jgi:hypothetical protein
MPKHFVNVYRVEDYYGGPEEGGWYYKEGIFVGRSVRVRRLTRAYKVQEELIKAFPKPEYWVLIEDHEGKGWSNYRPYE